MMPHMKNNKNIDFLPLNTTTGKTQARLFRPQCIGMSA